MIERIMNNILNEIKEEYDYIVFKGYVCENEAFFKSKKVNFDAEAIEEAIRDLIQKYEFRGIEATIHFNYGEVELYKNNETKSFKLENKDNLFSQLLEIINKEDKEDKGSEEDEN